MVQYSSNKENKYINWETNAKPPNQGTSKECTLAALTNVYPSCGNLTSTTPTSAVASSSSSCHHAFRGAGSQGFGYVLLLTRSNFNQLTAWHSIGGPAESVNRPSETSTEYT